MAHHYSGHALQRSKQPHIVRFLSRSFVATALLVSFEAGAIDYNQYTTDERIQMRAENQQLSDQEREAQRSRVNEDNTNGQGELTRQRSRSESDSSSYGYGYEQRQSQGSSSGGMGRSGSGGGGRGR